MTMPSANCFVAAPSDYLGAHGHVNDPAVRDEVATPADLRVSNVAYEVLPPDAEKH